MHPILTLALRKMGPLAPGEEKVGVAHSPILGVLRAVGDELADPSLAVVHGAGAGARGVGGDDALEELQVVGDECAGLSGPGKPGPENLAKAQCKSKRALLHAHTAGLHSVRV